MVVISVPMENRSKIVYLKPFLKREYKTVPANSSWSMFLRTTSAKIKEANTNALRVVSKTMMIVGSTAQANVRRKCVRLNLGNDNI